VTVFKRDIVKEEGGGEAPAGGLTEHLRTLWWRPYGGGIRQPYGTILSIVLVVCGVLFLPALLGGLLGSRTLVVALLLLLVPALPAAAAVLQGQVEPAPVNLFTLYLCEAFDLYFNLVFILLILPYLALKVLWAGSLVFLIAVTAGLLAGLLKAPHALEPAALRYFLLALGLAAAGTAAVLFLEGREDYLIQKYAGVRLAFFGRVRRL
jgi:hypothetical protein